ncbi:MAG TPA: glycosyltransferase family 2 protein [Candidatus Acidoferrales bacterium]|nr:glycosyltransferase family 2 protein [Candidatus Acidoferrales bacterium]
MTGLRIIGMIPVYNEEDVIGNLVEYLLSQGIELVILDNGSSDKSHEICSKFLNKGLLSLERMRTEKFQFNLLVQSLYDRACSFGAEWVLLNAADEFLESPYRDLTLKEAIENDAKSGYNMIQFNNFEFLPTDRDLDVAEHDIRKRLKYYTWNDNLQFRSWKIYPGIEVTGTAGHYPVFPSSVKPKIPKTKYILRHYRIRSYDHGIRKVFEDRLPRYPAEERNAGRHIHYDNFKRDPSYFIVNSANLIQYRNDGRWVTKKVFDWTWGIQGRPWAHPPKTSLLVQLANRFPLAVRIWKALFLRKKSLEKTVL